MPTVDKEIADRIIAGAYPEDDITLIVEYDNAFGGVSYGFVTVNHNQDTYLHETDFVRNPRVYWRKPEVS